MFHVIRTFVTRLCGLAGPDIDRTRQKTLIENASTKICELFLTRFNQTCRKSTQHCSVSIKFLPKIWYLCHFHRFNTFFSLNFIDEIAKTIYEYFSNFGFLMTLLSYC